MINHNIGIVEIRYGWRIISLSYKVGYTHCNGLYMTGFVQIDPNHTGTEIHFIAEH